MIVEILGSGCPKCEKVFKTATDVIDELEIDGFVQKITDMNVIMTRGVMMTPSIFVNGIKKVEGRVPDRDEIVKWIKEEMVK